MLGSARTWLTNRIRLVTWLGFVVTLSACVGGQQSVDFVGGAPAVEQLRIAVMPLENLTNFPRGWRHRFRTAGHRTIPTKDLRTSREL